MLRAGSSAPFSQQGCPGSTRKQVSALIFGLYACATRGRGVWLSAATGFFIGKACGFSPHLYSARAAVAFFRSKRLTTAHPKHELEQRLNRSCLNCNQYCRGRFHPADSTGANQGHTICVFRRAMCAVRAYCTTWRDALRRGRSCRTAGSDRSASLDLVEAAGRAKGEKVAVPSLPHPRSFRLGRIV
jgi:hypothetical protein